MTDHPVTAPEPWPHWLADLSPEQRAAAIVRAVAACYGGDDHYQPATQHCTLTMAEHFLLRLLGEARQQAHYLSTSCFHGEHRYCQSGTGAAEGGETWSKVPAKCKFCPATCRCGCHSGEPVAPVAGPASEPSPVPSAAEAQLAVAVPALRRLAADGDMTGGGPLIEELAERQRLAAGTLETIAQLSQVPDPEQPEPLTHFTTAGQSRLAADNFPACKAQHWAIVSPYVRQVTCDDCLTWLGSAVGNLTRALANAAATIERRDADLAEPDPLPPGFFGRVELPGFRNYTGWITQDGADRIVSDWDGNVLAEYQPGPNCLTIHLPTPQKRPEPQKAIAASSGYGDYEPDDDDPWGSDGDDG